MVQTTVRRIFHFSTMGWLRFVDSLKLYVSLENIGPFYRAVLHKRPIILRSLLAEDTPYSYAATTILPCRVTNPVQIFALHVVPHSQINISCSPFGTLLYIY